MRRQLFWRRGDLGADQFDVVIPSASIVADHPVAIVETVVNKKGSEKLAEAYLGFLWSDVGQEIIAKHHYRPRNPEILAQHADQFAKLELFTVKDIIPGGWEALQRIHFADGGVFDQIYKKE